MYKPKGMIPAMPTPFDNKGDINTQAYTELIDHLIDGGMHCLLAGGSTGEYTLMTKAERKKIISTAVKVADGKVPIMAGTSCYRTQDTIDMTKYAADIGASCALVITPYYMQTSIAGILDYYETIAKNSSIGIVIYHYPGATNVYLEPEIIHELSKIDNIVSVKNTTDQEHTCKVIGLLHNTEEFTVLTGYEHLILPTLSVGGAGATGIVLNLIPKEIAQLYDFVIKDKNMDAAIKLNQKLISLYDYVEQEPSPGPVKAGLTYLGMDFGSPRKPLVEPTQNLKDKIFKKLNELGYKGNT